VPDPGVVVVMGHRGYEQDPAAHDGITGRVGGDGGDDLGTAEIYVRSVEDPEFEPDPDDERLVDPIEEEEVGPDPLKNASLPRDVDEGDFVETILEEPDEPEPA
jgi:hypothetical protein